MKYYLSAFCRFPGCNGSVHRAAEADRRATRRHQRCGSPRSIGVESGTHAFNVTQLNDGPITPVGACGPWPAGVVSEVPGASSRCPHGIG